MKNILLLASALLCSTLVFGATGVVVPYGAGGATDFQARIVTMMAEDKSSLGEPVYILNKPGAGGRVGWSWFANRAPSDGSILASFNVPHFIAQSISDDVPYSVESFEPIATWGADPAVLVVPAESAIKDFEDFKAAASKKVLSVSGAGLLVGHHIAALQMEQETGLSIEYIPHPTGGAGALAGVVAGEFDAGINNMSDGIRSMSSGGVRIVAVFSEKRHPFIPDVPTMAEIGYPAIGNESVNFRGIMAKKGTSEEELDKLEGAFLSMFGHKKVASKMKAGGSPLGIMNRKETQALWISQQKSLERLLSKLK